MKRKMPEWEVFVRVLSKTVYLSLNLELLPSVLCTKFIQKGGCADVEICHLPFDCYPAAEGNGASEPSVCQQTVLDELWIE